MRGATLLVALVALSGCLGVPSHEGAVPASPGTQARCAAGGPLFVIPAPSAGRAPVPVWCEGDRWVWDVLDGHNVSLGRATWTVQGTEVVRGITAYVLVQDEPGWANHTVRYDVANLNEVGSCGKPGGLGDCEGRVPRFDFPLVPGKSWSYACCGGDVVFQQRANATYAGELPLTFSVPDRAPAWRIVETPDCCGWGVTEYVHNGFAPFMEKAVRGRGGSVTERWVLREAEAPRIPADCEQLDRNEQWWNATLDGPPFQVSLPWVGDAGPWNANVSTTGNANTSATWVEHWGEGLTITGSGHVEVRSHRAQGSTATTGCVAEQYLHARWAGGDVEHPERLDAILHDGGPVHVRLTYVAHSSWCGRDAAFEGNGTERTRLVLQGQEQTVCS